MLDKILLPVIGALIYHHMSSTSKKTPATVEHFGMNPSQQIKVDRQVAPNAKAAAAGQFTSIQNNYKSMLSPDSSFYTVPGNFQSLMAPRLFGGDYGANITYNLPSKANLAVPTNPLGYANAVKENFEGPKCAQGGGPLSYAGGAPLMQSGFANGNHTDVANKLYSGPETLMATRANLPVGDMTTMNSLGDEEQPIIYDRYMFANRSSRLYSQGDPIRGDLPIVPENNGWFNVSVQPNIDLKQGAMNVMGGINNETSQQLSDLIYTASGNSQATIAGMNLQNQLSNPALNSYSSTRMNSMNPLSSVNMGNQYSTSLSAAQGDINVSAYP